MNKGGNMKKCNITGFFVLILCAAGFLYAGETGEVFGSITYDDILMPGVTVEVDSPKLKNTLTTVSSEEGTFRFRDLPAGTYSFRFKLEGFKTILLKGIKVKPGKKIQLTPRMMPAALVEEIVVIGVRKTGEKKKEKSPASKSEGVISLTKPRLIKKATPKYPEEALKKGYHGDVVIRALINETGYLSDMRVKEGKYACLITAAVEALKKWQYKPYMVSGAPRSSEVSIKIMFQLKTGK